MDKLGQALQFFAQRLVTKTPAEQAQAIAALTVLAKIRASRGVRDVAADKRTAEHAAKARASLRVFVETAWPLVEPVQAFVPNWHIDTLCAVLEMVTRGEIDRLLVNVPPGTSKSLVVSVFWPAWEWASNPALRYFTASYDAALTIRDNLRLREIVTSDWYKTHFWNDALAKKLNVRDGIHLKGDQNEKVRFDTTALGWRIASSVGGRGMGEHPDRTIIDDPLTAMQARSDVERKRVIDWLKRTVSTRGVARRVAQVLIMQRLHQDDPSGYFIAQGGWHHICWPMRYDPSRPDPLDPREYPGELLWPDLFPEEVVRRLEIELDPYGASGQLQQNPAPEGGGLFKAEWFPIVDAAPASATRCRGWDVAATEGAGDWTAGVKMARAGPIFYVEDVRRGQWGPAGVEEVIAQTAMMDGRGCRQREEQEPGSSGKTVVADRSKLLVGYDYKGIPATGDKVTRARPYRAQCEAGNVRLVRGDWNAAYLAELSNFPVGSHDDQVDGSSTAFNELAAGPADVKQVQYTLG